VQYDDDKRPHQGIEGLCPVDRYFEIQAELRKTMEQVIADNVLEMALRGEATGAVLHGEADGGAVGGLPGGERKAALDGR
jgi:hypothetical protein